MTKTVIVVAPTLQQVHNYVKGLEPNVINVNHSMSSIQAYFTGGNVVTYKHFIDLWRNPDRLRGCRIDHMVCIGDFPHVSPEEEFLVRGVFDSLAYQPKTLEERVKELEEQVIKLGGKL